MSVLFGDAQLTTSGFTVLRVSVDNPPGNVAVFSGNAHLNAAGGNVSVDLHGGESLALNGATPANYQLAESIEPDSWDSWNSDRDQALTTEAASQTGASTNLGQSQNPAWNDLDADGNWYDVPNQGYIWSPNEAASADFDPYGNGNWMWTPGYGYLWISGYPWGYMPYQCGTWNFYNNFGWGWAPGMGGCSPWWGMGFYGGPNIGYGPPGYRPIPRPILPRHPINPMPVAMIPVRRTPVIVSTNLPARNRNTPVTIGGSTVVPLRPLPSRQVFAHTPANAGGNQTQPGNQGMPENGKTVTNRPGYSSPSAAPAEEPTHFNSSTQNHGSAPPRASSSSGGSANHSSSGGSSGGSSPHPSGGYSGGGGGGGGGSHSSGGGGGGGGGSHSSGGGGGGGGGGKH